MPFAASERPALGVSMLKAHLLRDGVSCDVAYLNLAFAELIGRKAYERIADGLPIRALSGEWVFAECLWGRNGSLPDSYVDDVLRKRWPVSEDDIGLVLEARDRAPGFLQSALASIPWADYDVVGFSSFTAQNLASLALAGLVKQRHPGVTVLFGGPNWFGRPGVRFHQRFSFVDLACSGEGDVTFPALVRSLAGDREAHLERIPGLIYRKGGVTRCNAEPEPFADLDTLPYPDFSDFYEARDHYPDVRSEMPSISVETSRGCWWATTGPCNFCGMDARRRLYRTKSADRIAAELRDLGRLWPCRLIYLADTVVSPAFLDEVLPDLAADVLPPRLFFEVRPNLTREQVATIAAIRAQIQPGVESFSDHVLHLMHKGTRALENIRLLKWCRSAGVKVHWNLLHGLPGETREDYDAMLALLPSIRFLEAPSQRLCMSVDRHSPYFEQPERHGITRLRPLAPYGYLYPFHDRVLADIAFAFQYECTADRTPPDLAAELDREVSQWSRESGMGDLTVLEETPDRVTLLDKRRVAAARTIELDDLESLLYSSSDDIGEIQALRARARDAFPARDDLDEAIDAALASLEERRLLAHVGDRYLSLAVEPRFD